MMPHSARSASPDISSSCFMPRFEWLWSRREAAGVGWICLLPSSDEPCLLMNLVRKMQYCDQIAPKS